MRVIAGEFGGHKGPAKTFTPMNVWDLRLNAGKTTTLSTPEGHTTAVIPMHGRAVLNGTQAAVEAQLAVFDRQGGDFTIGTEADATLLVLSGEPLNEPVVGYGPFVMTSDREIAEAIRDYQSGRFGSLPAS
jgi:redox-sensitive bicupin YhaK (pirin superfamily)